MLKLVMSVEVSSSSDDKPSLCSALFPFCSLACRRRVLYSSTNTKEAKLKTWAEIAFYQLGTKVTLSWSRLKIWCTENLFFFLQIYSWIHIIRFCVTVIGFAFVAKSTAQYSISTGRGMWEQVGTFVLLFQLSSSDDCALGMLRDLGQTSLD